MIPSHLPFVKMRNERTGIISKAIMKDNCKKTRRNEYKYL